MCVGLLHIICLIKVIYITEGITASEYNDKGNKQVQEGYKKLFEERLKGYEQSENGFI